MPGSPLRYHRRLEGAENQHDLDAAYNLRAATRLLGSDFVYARHRWEFRYMRTREECGDRRGDGWL